LTSDIQLINDKVIKLDPNYNKTILFGRMAIKKIIYLINYLFKNYLFLKKFNSLRLEKKRMLKKFISH